MKQLKALTVATLGIALAACPPPAGIGKPKTHILTVHADAAGQIDMSHHDADPVIDWRDRIQWTMECHEGDDKCEFPAGTQLVIENIRHQAVLSMLDEAEKKRVKAMAKAGEAVDPSYAGGPPDPPGPPFKNGLEPPDPNNRRVVRSTPYRGFDQEHLWKFTWVIKIDGKEVDRWDPHFSGRRQG